MREFLRFNWQVHWGKKQRTFSPCKNKRHDLLEQITTRLKGQRLVQNEHDRFLGVKIDSKLVGHCTLGSWKLKLCVMWVLWQNWKILRLKSTPQMCYISLVQSHLVPILLPIESSPFRNQTIIIGCDFGLYVSRLQNVPPFWHPKNNGIITSMSLDYLLELDKNG